MKYKGSIKNKLVLIILLVSILTTFIGYSSFVYWFMKNQYAKSIELSHTIGTVLSQNIAKLILLHDVSIAVDISSELESFKMLHKVVIYDLDKKIVYQYSKDNKYFKAKLLPIKLESKIIKNDLLIIYVKAKYQDTQLGYIQFTMKLKSIYCIVKDNIITILCLWFIMFLVSYLLAIYYAKEFISPILNLVSFLEEIETIDIYDKKITIDQDNEYGKLYDEINYMLQRIQKSHNTLKEHKDNLEDIILEKIKENTKQLEILQQQSKLASMGEMIGAIAHQWRQPLNAISTSIQNLKYDYVEGYLENEDFIKKFIEKNKKTIKFMSKTIDDFRGFFRVDKEKINFNVKETTQFVIDMQFALLKDNNIDLVISGDEFIFNGLQSEYQQVVLNIINNAKDALVENNIENPFIDIKLENNQIFIKDNAGGIPENLINRIFEPYFTTKEQGKGTGIGLYMSKMIIEDNMNANLSVKNVENGACFCINFK